MGLALDEAASEADAALSRQLKQHLRVRRWDHGTATLGTTTSRQLCVLLCPQSRLQHWGAVVPSA